jgi:hypothetical protein
MKISGSRSEGQQYGTVMHRGNVRGWVVGHARGPRPAPTWRPAPQRRAGRGGTGGALRCRSLGCLGLHDCAAARGRERRRGRDHGRDGACKAESCQLRVSFVSASCQLRVSAGTYHSTTSLIPRGVMDFSEQASPEQVRWIIAHEGEPEAGCAICAKRCSWRGRAGASADRAGTSAVTRAASHPLSAGSAREPARQDHGPLLGMRCTKN